MGGDNFGALECLVADGVISAGRARELHGMNPEQQRAFWKECHESGVCVTAIMLRISPEGTAEVHVERGGSWYRVIKELHIEGGITSHIVESGGIERAPMSDWSPHPPLDEEPSGE